MRNFEEQLFPKREQFEENNVIYPTRTFDYIAKDDFSGVKVILFRSSHPEMFIRKGVIKIYSKFTEHQ